jgi:DNA-binding NarL/FixJ family response regulator
MLVDDNPFFIDAARDFLGLHKTVELVGTASDGQGALEQALSLRPDVILLDLNLQEESSIPLIPILKQHLPQARIVVITILEETGYSEMAIESGADAFIRKRAMPQTLLPSIADLYDKPERPQDTSH